MLILALFSLVASRNLASVVRMESMLWTTTPKLRLSRWPPPWTLKSVKYITILCPVAIYLLSSCSLLPCVFQKGETLYVFAKRYIKNISKATLIGQLNFRMIGKPWFIVWRISEVAVVQRFEVRFTILLWIRNHFVKRNKNIVFLFVGPAFW